LNNGQTIDQVLTTAAALSSFRNDWWSEFF